MKIINLNRFKRRLQFIPLRLKILYLCFETRLLKAQLKRRVEQCQKEASKSVTLVGGGLDHFLRVKADVDRISPGEECRYLGPDKLPDALAHLQGLADHSKRVERSRIP